MDKASTTSSTASSNLMKRVIEAGPELDSGCVILKERLVCLRKSDRVAFVMLNAAMEEYPQITTGEMLEALMDAIWWVKDVAIAKFKPTVEPELIKLQ